jgi:2-methylcitrate dehydratase PrpD
MTAPPWVSGSPERTAVDPYLAALTDWLACAAAGSGERGPRALLAAGDGLLDRIAFAGAAGHVLDFDDTFADGVAHVSAATAPAALMLGATLGRSLGDALRAYAAGFEAMASLAEECHPALYDAGWHPTTVCGPVGAAIAACELLGVSGGTRRSAVALALLRAGGTRGAFGSDGKAIQVGLASAAGVQAALAAQGGASVDYDAVVDGPLGFLAVTGARATEPGESLPRRSGDPGWIGDSPQEIAGPSKRPADPGGRSPAIARNWLKLHPSCLGTHAPIDCAVEAAAAGLALGTRSNSIEIVVHPLARQAAHIDAVTEPLTGKFSIPYCVAFTLLHGPPTVADFLSIDPAAVSGSGSVSVRVERSMPDWGSALIEDGRELIRVPCPRGAPERPIGEVELVDKVRALAGEGLLDAIADLDAPAELALRAAGLWDFGADTGVSQV